MTTVLLIVISVGFVPVTFPSVVTCERAWRTIVNETGWSHDHHCIVVRTR